MTQSPSQWDIVKALRPFNLDEISLVDRMVRGEAWTFVHNQVTGQHMRVNAVARMVLHALDARSSVEEIVESLSLVVSDAEKEALALSLVSLSEQGMISLADAAHESRLQERISHKASQGKRMWHNPLAIRVPLHDPDRWLASLVACLNPALNKRSLIIASLIMLIAVYTAFLHRQELLSQLHQVAATPKHWWQFAVLYPLLKCVHELAHAIAIKRWGGEVHEVGITVLVLMPIPYVDATDIWRFERRYQRILVSAAGMLAEGFLAAIGLLTWLLVEPGALYDLGFALALTGSVSTLLFNANPLLKFDGYHILQDALDIPNLASRATRYLQYLTRRYVLAVSTASSPVTADSEKKWLFMYGVCAGFYRWIITLGIALYLASRFPLLGTLLALFALFQLIVHPLVRVVGYLHGASELQGRRGRVVCGVVLCLGVGVVCFVVVPIPTNTRAQGIVGLPTQSEIYAPESGQIKALLITQGQQVMANQLLFKLDAPDLETRLAVMQAGLAELSAQYQAALVSDVVASRLLLLDLEETRSRLAQLSARVASLSVRALVDGTISLDLLNARIGQYVHAGNALGYVVDSRQLLVKAIVPQSEISRVREGVNSVSIRLAERFSEPLIAHLVHETPAANHSLPSQALAYNGHSGIAVASNGENQWKTVEPVFHVEFSLPTTTSSVGIGGRAYVTMNHAAESIGQRSWRSIRQLLLDQLAI